MVARPWSCPSWLWDSFSRCECDSSSNRARPPRRVSHRSSGASAPGLGTAAVGKRIVVNAGVTETRLAVQDGSQLVELYVERAGRRSIVGNIYKGIVTNVLPGMQAAFVDIGLQKDAFLYVGDYTADRGEDSGAVPPDADEDPVDLDDGEDEPLVETEPEHRRDATPIEELLRKGQEVLVQVSKESLGTKGARITSFVSIPGRYIVYMPQSSHVGVSRRIHDDAERDR